MRAFMLARLAWLLGLANAHARGSTHSDGLYALKDRLLHRWGRPDGDDVQRIVKRCWGYYEDGACRGRQCNRCGGTGIWEQRLVRLERWELGGRVFHRPAGPVWGPVWETRVNIEGLVQHADVPYRTSVEAALWLALLFDRPLWYRMLRSSRASVLPGWRYPMHALQALVFEARIRLARLIPATRSCWRCSRMIWTWERRVGAIYCRRCAPLAHAQIGEDNDLPF